MKVIVVLSAILLVASASSLRSSAKAIKDLLPLPESRIIGGNVAAAGQFKYIVHLQISDNSGRSWSCGGSILNNYWVLTAAHCTSGKFRSRIGVLSFDPIFDGWGL